MYSQVFYPYQQKSSGFLVSYESNQTGDPLSSFLFILDMEGLSCMLEKAKQILWPEGFRIGNSCVNSVFISHLLLQMTLFLYGAEKTQVLYLNLTLMILEAMSGLHITC